jgi:hypothetical protein
MKTLFVAWKQKDPGGWHPVGRLDADVKNSVYSFRYVQGARDAEKAGFAAFDSFPELEKEYVSGELFPFFLNRIQNPNRTSFPEYLQRMDFAAEAGEAYDPIELLAVSEGRRETDNLEVFPKIERIEGNPFAIKFFLHGVRYLSSSSQTEILKLTHGEELTIALELNNPATFWAIQLQSRSRVVVGYAPRYLLDDLVHVTLNCLVSAKVTRVNPLPAPPQQRVMIQLEGCWPADYAPMSGEQFRPLVESSAPFHHAELAA